MNNTTEISTEFSSLINSAITFANKKSDLLLPTAIINYKGIGIVYFIYLVNIGESKINLVYIGKSKGHLFKTRIRNHFFKKHAKTGSKLSLVKTELAKGNELKLKFLKVNPESFRNTLEEELINYFKPIWNSKE